MGNRNIFSSFFHLQFCMPVWACQFKKKSACISIKGLITHNMAQFFFPFAHPGSGFSPPGLREFRMLNQLIYQSSYILPSM